MPARSARSPRKRGRKSAAPTPGRRAQNKEATRTRIVDEALALFQSKGFDATTTREIARKARIAEGTIFNYFPTKEDIALHFFEKEVDHAIDVVRANKRLKKAPLEEKLFALVQSQLDYLAPYENFIGASLIHALRPASRLGPFSLQMQALRLRYVTFVQELVDESLPENGAGPLSIWGPQAFWIFYLGALLYWLHDTSEGKQQTLAFLDRSLTMGVAMLKRADP
jgi:AcrR family transcriptional regulator